MNEKYYGKIVGKNLKRIAYEHRKTQADIAKDLGLSKSTVSSWMNGTRVPRMDKIDLLCHYFNCKRVDIMEDHSETDEYYISQETARCMMVIQTASIGISRNTKKNLESLTFHSTIFDTGMRPPCMH